MQFSADWISTSEIDFTVSGAQIGSAHVEGSAREGIFTVREKAFRVTKSDFGGLSWKMFELGERGGLGKEVASVRRVHALKVISAFEKDALELQADFWPFLRSKFLGGLETKIIRNGQQIGRSRQRGLSLSQDVLLYSTPPEAPLFLLLWLFIRTSGR
jgi:hypothetical protein